MDTNTFLKLITTSSALTEGLRDELLASANLFLPEERGVIAGNIREAEEAEATHLREAEGTFLRIAKEARTFRRSAEEKQERNDSASFGPV